MAVGAAGKGELGRAPGGGDGDGAPAEGPRVVLRLYVTGGAPRSAIAVRNVRLICEEHLRGRYDLHVIDIFQQPWLALDAQLVAAPTLVKELPLPPQRFIGVLSDARRLLEHLGCSPGAAEEIPR